MADAYVKVLKEDNGDIIYPQTVSTAVFTSNGSDVETEMGKYVTATDIVSTSALSPVVSTAMIQDEAVTTAKIDDGAITAAKIDWTSILCGTTPTASSIASMQDKTVTVNIPTQANTDYKIFLQQGSGNSYWTWIAMRPKSKTTTSFEVQFYNNGSGTSGDVWAYYLLIP